MLLIAGYDLQWQLSDDREIDQRRADLIQAKLTGRAQIGEKQDLYQLG